MPRSALDLVPRVGGPPGATPIYLPQAAALVDSRGFVTRPWWPWFEQIVAVLQALVANGGGGGGAGDVFTDRANVFTAAPQTLQAAGPALVLTDTTQAPNAQRVAVRNSGGLLRLEAQNDAGTPLAAVTIDRSGVLTAAGLDGTPLTAAMLTGTVPLASLPAHHPTHEAGGADAIKLDDLAAPDDTADLNATTGRHGLLPKLSGAPTTFLTGVGTWAPASGGGGGDVIGPASAVHNNLVSFNGTSGKVIGDSTISGGDVALKPAANVFTANQMIQGAYPVLTWNDVAGPSGLRRWRIYAGGGFLIFDLVSDDGSMLVAQPLVLGPSGLVSAGGGVSERGRLSPMGEWAAVPYSAGLFGSSGGSWTVEAGDVLAYQYMLVGKTLFINFCFVNTDLVSVGAELRVFLPTPYQAVAHATGVAQGYAPIAEPITIVVNAGATFLSFQRQASAAWGSGNFSLRGQVFFQVY